ncbi:GGDEF domain-containing protein [Vibrio aquaticus]|uniref:diguanylate cyclase n=1 Tax=Vibrio aquaticus TaxID=2496559 RepID=A0A432CT62_9VIBR|nr:GGDEF domain-containing protein [Vibrio aquaticus]RTZ14419.1 GGDEF domain-containing protein [Vibrio aquaticus]
MNSILVNEVSRRKHLEVIDGFPVIALIHSLLAVIVVAISLYSYGLTHQLMIWIGLFPTVIGCRFIADKLLRPQLVAGELNKLSWIALMATRSLLGFVWAVGTIWFIQIDPERNLLAATIWCTALAYAGTIFHVNSIPSLQTYFWSLMAPLSLYFALELHLYFEVVVITIAGIVYVTLYTKVLHSKATTRISETVQKERLIEELSEANHQIKMLAQKDALTGLKNRMYFNEQLEELWAKSIENRSQLSLILFDIDHFKAFNDNYGHLAGDKAIKAVADCLNHIELHTSKAFFARVGGEEFIAVLPQLGLDIAIDIAEEIRLQVEQSAVPHHYSSTSEVLTVSLGVAMTEPTANTHINDLFEQADQALYRAKEGGRNIVATTLLHPHRAAFQGQPE